MASSDYANVNIMFQIDPGGAKYFLLIKHQATQQLTNCVDLCK